MVVLARLGPAVATTAAATTSVVESTAAATADTTAANTTADSVPPSVEGLLALDFGTVGAGTIGVQSDGSVQIDLTNADVTLDCLGRVVHVDGAATDLTLVGECPELEVGGATNNITVETVGRIVVTGISNDISWVAALKGGPPDIEDTGISNEIVNGDE